MKSYPSNPVDNLSTAQTHLVRACLATNPAARAYYVRKWEETVHILELDFSSSRLVPYFLHQNQHQGITSRYDKRLKVIYKHWWLRTHHINHQLGRVHAAFRAAGINTVVIKGASLKQHYERPELRPMGDFDLLVPKEQLHRAIHTLRELDFIPSPVQLACLHRAPDLLLDFTHAISLAHRSNDTYIDLHWRVGSRCTWAFTNQLWAHLVPYPGSPGAQKPTVAYELFMLLIHAADSSNKDNLNWLIDVAVLHPQLTTAVWKAARQLAMAESKTDLFDYACCILLQFGVAAPNPGPVPLPRRVPVNLVKTGGIIQRIQQLPRKIRFLFTTVNRLYPHASTPAKGYQVLRRLRLFFVASRLRKRAAG